MTSHPRHDVERADADWTPERLIALVRLGLAAGGLVVIWLDPTQPKRNWEVAYAALVLYVVYSAAIAHLVRSRPAPWLPLGTQVIDLLWIVPVVYFTEAANSPFFPFFVTFTFTAGIRWGRWASWAVCLYSLVVYAFLLLVETPTPLDLNNDLMRIGYFFMVGVLGGYLTEYRRQREREFKTLRTASQAIGTKRRAVDAMAAIVDIARRDRLADEVLGILREPEDGQLMIVRGAHDVALLGDEEAAPFLAAASRPALHEDTQAAELGPAGERLLSFADADQGVVYPIRTGDDLAGAMFFFFHTRRPGKPSRFLTLFLQQVIPHLETLYVLERAPQMRVMEERRRIARDLHDSFIQALAAVGLRLDVLGASTARTAPPAELARDLAQLRDLVLDEQRRVRAYVTEMREPVGEAGDLPETIAHVVATFQARTGLPVDTVVSEVVPQVPRGVIRELALLLREALTNVEKHAHATRVAVTATVEGQDMVLSVRDDGIGIRAPTGAWPASDAAATHGHGLSTMQERAQILGGTFAIDRAEKRGTRVRVIIPLAASTVSGP